MDALHIPVYLNQRLVFDMIATLQGGISTVRSINTLSASSSLVQGDISSKFGLNSVFSSLLSINVDAKRSTSDSDQKKETFSEERVHTPASLFNQLREDLFHRKLIKKMNLDANIKPGDIVEFEADLNINPALEYLMCANKVMEVSKAYEELKQKIERGQRKPGKAADQVAKDKSSAGFSLMKSFYDELFGGATIDLLSKIPGTSYEAVITLDKEFLNDPTMSDLVDGTFKVAAKVIKVVNDDEKGISLIRKTTFSAFPQKSLDEMIASLNNLAKGGNLNFPEFRNLINGPAIQVIPIAIYA